MTTADQELYRAAWAAQAKIAKQHRRVIHHVIWRDGHMTCQSAVPERPAAIEPPPISRRGVAQGLLI